VGAGPLRNQAQCLLNRGAGLFPARVAEPAQTAPLSPLRLREPHANGRV